MKTLLTTLSFLALSLVANATKFVYAKIVLVDGTSRVGLVENSLDNDYVRFKSADGAESEKIASEGIRTVAYLKEDLQTPVVEYDRIKVYLGWGQRRISDYAWFEVVVRGPCSGGEGIQYVGGGKYGSLVPVGRRSGRLFCWKNR